MSEKKKKGTTLAERWANDDNPIKILEEPEEETKKSFSVFKTDDDKRLVFGWASVSITVDGEQLEDRQKDIIEPEDLEEAAYEYVLNFRDTGEEHISSMRKKGKLVESCVFTEEKQQAMGIPAGILPIGWWIGFKIEDDDAWERVKNGTYRMFSIEGKATREPVEKFVDNVEKSRRNYDEYPEYGMWLEENLDATIEEQKAAEAHYAKQKKLAKTFNELVEKANPYHGADGRFTSANGGGGAAAAPKMSAATAISEYQNYAYQSVNEGLRTGKLEGKAKEISDALDEAIEQAEPTKYQQTLHRADGAATTAELWEKADLSSKLPQSGDIRDVWGNPEARGAITQAMVGQTFTDKGFMSTSKDYETAEQFVSGNRYNPHGVEGVVHINVPKGSKVLDLGDDGFISGSGEGETILPRGSSYKITAVLMNYRANCLDIYADIVTDGVGKSAAAATTFYEVLKFNPYHGRDGRFSSANAAASFTFAPGKSKAHDLAIQREKERHAAAGGAGKEPEKKVEYKQLNRAKVEAMAKQMGQDQISDEDIDQMESHGTDFAGRGGYFGTGHSFSLNEDLRKVKDPKDLIDADDRMTCETLDKHMKPCPENISLGRAIGSSIWGNLGLDYDAIKAGDDAELQKAVGKVYGNKGYTSTSYDMEKNVFKTRQTKLNISAPAGTKMLIRPGGEEAEILLARNTALQIKGVRRVKGKDWFQKDQIEVDCEVILLD